MIPGPIITMLVSTVISFIFKYMQRKQENEKLRFEAEIARYKQADESREKARQFAINFPAMAWTRRLIVISLVGYVFLGRFYAGIAHTLEKEALQIPITMGYMEEGCKFLFWGGLEKMKFKELSGYTIIPLDVHACMAVIGFYFGGKE